MRRFPLHALTPILGKEAGLFAWHLDRLVPQVDGTRYEFEDARLLAELSPPEMNRVYWQEILARSHWAAAATMVRTSRWLSGLKAAHADSNLLAFAACARGLIEAAADAEYTLCAVPLTLARDRLRLQAALAGTLLSLFVIPELEDRLIHFTHARKPNRGEAVPQAHVALQVSRYRERLAQVQPKVSELYSQLCDLTHPGASSVLSYAEALKPDASTICFSVRAEGPAHERLRSSLQAVAPDILMLGLNPAFAALKVLNALPVTALHTPAVDDIDMSDVSLWQKARASLVATT